MSEDQKGEKGNDGAAEPGPPEGAAEPGPPRVIVFGATVAGLTAAHELAARGFKVTVMDRSHRPDKDGKLGIRAGGSIRTHYVCADISADSDQWEDAYPSEIESGAAPAPVPVRVPPKIADLKLIVDFPNADTATQGDHGAKGAPEETRAPFDEPPFKIQGAKPLENDPLKWKSDTERAICLDSSRQILAALKAQPDLWPWYCIVIEGHMNGAIDRPKGVSDAERPSQLRQLWLHRLNAVEAIIREFVANASIDLPEIGRYLSALAAESITAGSPPEPIDEAALRQGVADMLDPVLGMSVLRKLPEVDAVIPKTEGVSPRASLTFKRMFPMEIALERVEYVSVPRLSTYAAAQVESLARSIRHITKSYRKSPWVRITITGCDDLTQPDGIARAERASRLLEERLKEEVRRTTTNPRHDLIIVRRTAQREPPGSGLLVRVDLEPTFPLNIRLENDGSTPDADSALRIDALATSLRALTSRYRVPQWFQWKLDVPTTNEKLPEWWEQLRRQIEEHGGKLASPEPRHNAGKTTLDLRPTILPGEHRTVVIAPHHRNLLDTLARIPVSKNGNEAPTRSTVLESLVCISRPGAPGTDERSPPDRAIVDLRTPGAFFDALRDAPGAFAQLVLRMLRYATTCSERRARELESLTFWEYVQGCDNPGRIPRYRYPDRFKSDLSLLCRLVAVADPEVGDARTCGNAILQVLYTWLRPTPSADRTLSQPTSEAWLDVWVEHLAKLGVKFEPQELDGIHWERDRRAGRDAMVAYCRPRAGETEEKTPAQGRPADYYVLALDATEAGRVTRTLEGGVPTQLARWLDAGAHTAERRFQDVSGIQYFFVTDDISRIEPAYFCVRAFPWCLSVVTTGGRSSDASTSRSRRGFTAMVSVDILAWDVPNSAVAGRSAGDCSRPELAAQVWRVVAPHIHARLPQGAPPLEPRWYHIDERIEYLKGNQRRAPVGPPFANKSPYAVPLAGDWPNRPGTLALDPAASQELASDLWQSKQGGYIVHGGRLVFAGHYLKTRTRTSTLEAANESARHAVNAVLAHFDESVQKGKTTRRLEDKGRYDAFNESWSLDDERIRTRPLPLEREAVREPDPCTIFDPEAYELAELEQLKKLDEECWKNRLPHPWDLFGIETIPSLMSWIPHPAPEVKGYAYGARDVPPPAAWSGEAVIRLMRSVRELLEQHMKDNPHARQGVPGSATVTPERAERSPS